LLQTNSYGYAYGSNQRGRNNTNRNNGGSRGEAAGGASVQAGGGKETRLKGLIKDIRSTVNETKDFWIRLPYQLCKEDDEEAARRQSYSSSSRSRYGRQQQQSRGGREEEDNCWNGHDAGRYTNAVVNDGLVYQEQNPEVSVDISRPDVYINEQILALKLITKKLESAHKGQNVEWPSASSCKSTQRPK
jgi:hypothetical protein